MHLACTVLSGVPQETVLTLLFLIYVRSYIIIIINDLPQSISNMLRLYADDILPSIQLLIV